jgi:putative transposase
MQKRGDVVEAGLQRSRAAEPTGLLNPGVFAVPRRTTEFFPGEFYHVYNRGNNYQDIFFERRNWIFFLDKLRLYLAGDPSRDCASARPKRIEPSAHVVAYCLMPNHYHLCV